MTKREKLYQHRKLLSKKGTHIVKAKVNKNGDVTYYMPYEHKMAWDKLYDETPCNIKLFIENNAELFVPHEIPNGNFYIK